MNPAAYHDWSAANQQYLTGRIKQVKMQLEWYQRIIRDDRQDHTPPDFSAVEEELKNLAAAMSAPPALQKLVILLGLSEFERNILLLCAGVELDAGLATLVASVQQEATAYLPSFGLVLATFPEAHWSAVSPAGPLRYRGLITIDKNHQLLIRRSISIDEHILHYLTGINNQHGQLKEIAAPVYPVISLVPSQRQLAEQIIQICAQEAGDGGWPVIQLSGNDRTDKLAVAAHLATLLGLQLYTISACSLPAGNLELGGLARLWEREAALNDYLLFLDCTHLDISDNGKVQSVAGFIEQMQGLLVLQADQWTPDIRRAKRTFSVEKPAPDEQKVLWETIITKQGDPKAFELEKIVAQFNLSSGVIHAAGKMAFGPPAVNGSGAGVLPEQLQQTLWKICCEHTRPQVDELAHCITPVAGWDDLVLPEAQKSILREMAAQIKQRYKVYGEWGFAKKESRGLGISALFAGESGTGKTMAAEVLAKELRLDLYRIDLSKVVNKYIGETEKNLKKIFDAAEDGGAILLFDEADALFGKRSDVKDSHDRYSNIEVSYLLQRMEAYRGLAILTTNMKSALDKAFLRRIRFIVQFPYPDALLRAEIWKRVFPAQTPVKDLDIEKLARLSVPGGNIRNIALNAAFIAADENEAVQMSHISRAVRTEYSKIEKTLGNAETGGWL